MQQDPNYGSPREEPRLSRVPMGGGMSAQDERTWSMIAHLSVLLSLVTGIGGPIAALVIWLVYKDRSQRVAFHALQDRKSTRLNSSHANISYAVFCLKKN